ncbi:MAG TPA: hypothetical protein VOA87_05260 [Thermoanaerobaculia bacterium]|nr:hypothetical protein [Thermoanaerobaculia bacterium]
MRIHTFIFLGLLLPALTFAQNVAVWDFSTRDGRRDSITERLTEEFEEALKQHTNYTVLERRKLDRLRAVIDSENALREITQAESRRLELLGVSVVAFGEIVDDPEDGDVSVVVKFEDFTGKQLLIQRETMGRAQLKDPVSRREKMTELAKKISGMPATTDPRALQQPRTQSSVVFDEKERVLADFGAMSLLEGVVVTHSQTDQTLLIVVKPREFLGVEPILTSLDSTARITGERGSGFTWVFRVYWLQFLLVEMPPEPSAPHRFRLEILK